MNHVKVYNSLGVYVESFAKPKIYPQRIDKSKTGGEVEVILHNWNHMIWYLNQCGYWIKGQKTDKGVRIK